jgi:ATP synthase F1 delta subunit
MSISQKRVLSYSRSFFQNYKDLEIIDKVTDEVDLAEGEENNSVNLPLPPNVFSIGQELKILAAMIVNCSTLKENLKSPYLSSQQKYNLLLSLSPGICKPLMTLLQLLKENDEFSLLPEIEKEYSKLLFQFQNFTKVKVIGATKLQKENGPLIFKTLKKLTQASNILLTLGYQKKLLGGIVFEYKSTSVDASIFQEFSLFFTDI